MAVPARPTSGVPIETAWGQVAHDTAVAQDIQAGSISITLTAAASANGTVTFPRAFASPPTVVVAQAGGSSGYIVAVSGATTGQCVVTLGTRAGGTASATIPVTWIAYGPRA
jgi:hypothetical protein